MDRFPNYSAVIQNCGSALVGLWLVTRDESKLRAAWEHYDRALKLTPERTYDIACLAALTGDSVAARNYLKICIEAGTAPPRNHIVADKDLASLRGLPWFDELCAQRG